MLKVKLCHGFRTKRYKISHSFILFLRSRLAVWHCNNEVRYLPQMFSDVSVDERVPRSQWVESADENDNLLGNGAT